jgi:hypothetical protein
MSTANLLRMLTSKAASLTQTNIPKLFGGTEENHEEGDYFRSLFDRYFIRVLTKNMTYWEFGWENRKKQTDLKSVYLYFETKVRVLLEHSQNCKNMFTL